MKIPIIYKVESAFICLRVLINSYKDLNKLYKKYTDKSYYILQ